MYHNKQQNKMANQTELSVKEKIANYIFTCAQAKYNDFDTVFNYIDNISGGHFTSDEIQNFVDDIKEYKNPKVVSLDFWIIKVQDLMDREFDFENISGDDCESEITKDYYNDLNIK